jgi:hypothetical protein
LVNYCILGNLLSQKEYEGKLMVVKRQPRGIAAFAQKWGDDGHASPPPAERFSSN